ncbi:MAG: peptidoglycan binding protein CsiV, partial [Gammaproteobacteria bacterium]|nr:peptidoglycan binding protein CsiV [Gammaproteobacteria bacterium]
SEINQKNDYLTLEEYRLTNKVTQLIEHPDYNVLIHKAWKQRGLDSDEAFSVFVDSRTQTNMTEHNNIKQQPGDINSPVSIKSFITGNIKLIMSRYLHINTDLIYTKQKAHSALSPVDLDENPAIKETIYPILFERRMRSRETHYIDHPLVGMIILATPYKITQDEDTPIETHKTI